MHCTDAHLLRALQVQRDIVLILSQTQNSLARQMLPKGKTSPACLMVPQTRWGQLAQVMNRTSDQPHQCLSLSDVLHTATTLSLMYAPCPAKLGHQHLTKDLYLPGLISSWAHHLMIISC